MERSDLTMLGLCQQQGGYRPQMDILGGHAKLSSRCECM